MSHVTGRIPVTWLNQFFYSSKTIPRSGIGRVALDTRLGCLSPDVTSDSETQRIIDAAKYALRNVAVLELKAPYWRYIPTPLWTKYVNNMNFFVE